MPRSAVRLVLLWLAGTDLRLTLLAVPPVLPIIHQDLQLDEKGIAALSSLPVLVLGAMAVPGSVLIARLGARRALLIGLWLIGVSSAVRGLGPSIAMLFTMTLLMGAGIAISQPTMAALVRQWFPHAVTGATGFWSNGLLVGELLSASLTLPLVLPLVGSWEANFVVWSVPVVATAILITVLTPHDQAHAQLFRGAAIPDWRSPRLWQLGFLQASASFVYFGGNTFIPDYLHAHDHPELVGAALAALNGGQVPASLVIGLVPLPLLARKAVSLGVGGLILAALAVVVLLPGWPLVAAAGVFGFCAAYILVLSFALPALLARPSEVAWLAAGTFTISYTSTFVVTVLAGALWDATHLAATAFVPVLFACGIVAVLGPRLSGSAARQQLREVDANQQRQQHGQAVDNEPAAERSA